MWKMHLWKLQVSFLKSSTWEKNKSIINIPTRVPNTEIINSFAINKNGFLHLSIEFGINLILFNKPSNKIYSINTHYYKQNDFKNYEHKDVKA